MAAGASSTRPRRLPALPTITVTRPRLPTFIARAGQQTDGVLAERTEGLRAATRPVWGPVAAFLRWISPLGWSILALGVVCWVVAAVADWDEWAMIGAAAMALVLCCALLAVGRTRVRIDTEVDPLRVTVGRARHRPDLGHQRVAARHAAAARRAARGHHGGPVHPAAAGFGQGARGAVRRADRASRRHRVGPASTVQGDPLGIVRRTLRWTDVTELFVHPRTISLESLGRRAAARPRG